MHCSSITIAKTWRQPESPSRGAWPKKNWYTYRWNISQGKKNETMPFAAPCMILEVIRQIVLSQKAKDTYPIISLIGLS